MMADDHTGPAMGILPPNVRLGKWGRFLYRYAIAAGCVAGTSLVRAALTPVIGNQSAFVLLAPAALLAAHFAGLGPGIAALVAGIIVSDFFFSSEPRSWGPYGAVEITLIISYSATAGAGIWLLHSVQRARARAEAASEEIRRHASELKEQIRQREQVEAELRAAKEQLLNYSRNLERMVSDQTGALQASVRSLESVLYHIAHDLLAPLRAMLGFTEILMEECPTDSKGLECSRHIAEAAVRMDRLLRDLLEYGRACHVQTVPARIDLCEAVDSVLKRFLPQTESGEAVIEVREPLLTVWADREFVNLALTELVANALKFVPSGKKSRIEINSERRKDKVRLWIADNCESISPQYHERIFGIFERLHSTRASEGTGIGLAVVKKVMERLRGDVGWKPGVREGNRFWLEFPADYCEKQDELRSDSASDKSTRTSELSI